MYSYTGKNVSGKTEREIGTVAFWEETQWLEHKSKKKRFIFISFKNFVKTQSIYFKGIIFKNFNITVTACPVGTLGSLLSLLYLMLRATSE